MKKTLVFLYGSALAVVIVLVGGTARADLVYANSTNDLSLRFNPLLFEVGDEIVLDGTARYVTNFNFQYWGVGFDGDEALRVRFYVNDGPAAPAGPTIYEPGTVLFDSGTFPIVATNRAVLLFDYYALMNGNVIDLLNPVPNSFTWSVQFYNTNDNAGFSAGLDIYDPPTVGSNYKDFWEYNGTGWEYRGDDICCTNYNFAARVEATPEPAVVVLGLLGGVSLLLLAVCRRRR